MDYFCFFKFFDHWIKLQTSLNIIGEKKTKKQTFASKINSNSNNFALYIKINLFFALSKKMNIYIMQHLSHQFFSSGYMYDS